MSSTTLLRTAPSTTLPPAHVAPGAGAGAPRPNPYSGQRMRRSLGRHAISLIGWTSIAMVLAIYFADRGTSGWDSLKDAMKSAGILAGLVSADLMCMMVLLAARIPFVEKLLGQDKAIGKHSGLGTWVVGGVLAHGVLLTWSYAMSANTTFLHEFTQLWTWGDYALAVISFGLLLAVGLTSALLGIRKHLPYELWHAVHLTTYVAVALSIPHQFSMDSMFESTWAKAYWIGLYAFTGFCLLAYRVVLPMMVSSSHRLVVTAVTPEGPDLFSIEMTGHHLDQLDAKGGQFLNWRFWTPGLALQSHPFSLSAAPDGNRLRITVKVAGRGTARMVRLRPGTRVSIEGPYGAFTAAARTRQAVVMVGSASGIAPIRSLLEGTTTVPGRSLVVLRASRGEQIVHFDEFRALCRERGVQLVTLVGGRGDSWTPASAAGVTLVQLAPWIADADVFVCGPRAWADQVLDEAGRFGVHPSQMHHEAFAL